MPEVVLECIMTLNNLGKNVQMQCQVKGLAMLDWEEKKKVFHFIVLFTVLLAADLFNLLYIANPCGAECSLITEIGT